MNGETRKRGRIWWIRYYDGTGHRFEESSKSSSGADALRLLNLRKRIVKKSAKPKRQAQLLAKQIQRELKILSFMIDRLDR